MSDRDGGEIFMNVGKKFANTVFIDYLGNREDKVYIDNEGNGTFYCNGGSVSIWIKEGQIVN